MPPANPPSNNALTVPERIALFPQSVESFRSALDHYLAQLPGTIPVRVRGLASGLTETIAGDVRRGTEALRDEFVDLSRSAGRPGTQLLRDWQTSVVPRLDAVLDLLSPGSSADGRATVTAAVDQLFDALRDFAAGAQQSLSGSEVSPARSREVGGDRIAAMFDLFKTAELFRLELATRQNALAEAAQRFVEGAGTRNDVSRRLGLIRESLVGGVAEIVAGVRAFAGDDVAVSFERGLGRAYRRTLAITQVDDGPHGDLHRNASAYADYVGAQVRAFGQALEASVNSDLPPVVTAEPGQNRQAQQSTVGDFGR